MSISFCDYCGDFFARTDSLKRHVNQRFAECLEVRSEKAEEKCQEGARGFHGEGVTKLDDR